MTVSKVHFPVIVANAEGEKRKMKRDETAVTNTFNYTKRWNE